MKNIDVQGIDIKFSQDLTHHFSIFSENRNDGRYIHWPTPGQFSSFNFCSCNVNEPLAILAVWYIGK